MTDRSVLILGANGRFGRATVDAFAAAGWRVCAQARRPPATPWPRGVRPTAAALTDVDALQSSAAGAKVVVHAVNPLYTRWSTDLLPTARQAMDLAERLQARLVLPGNVYAYGAGMPRRLVEDTPQRPTTGKGCLRMALEDEIAARCAQGLRASIVRAGDFYGAGHGSWFDLMIAKGIARGRLVYPGPMDRAHAWAYLPDLARAVVGVAARDDAPAFERLHFPGHTLTGAQLLDALERAAHALGIGPAGAFTRRRQPWWPIRLAGLVWPMGRAIAEMAYLWEVPHELDGTRLQAVLGTVPATPVETALRAALHALRADGTIGGRAIVADGAAGAPP